MTILTSLIKQLFSKNGIAYLVIAFAICSFCNISSYGLTNLDEVVKIVKEKHVKEISDEQIISAAANGILNSLDPYSYFYNQQDWLEINNYTNGEFSGVGLEVQIDQGKAVIITPLLGSPAAKAGILPRDEIIAINGMKIIDLSKQQILKNLLGKKNTKLIITIIRRGVFEPLKFSILRKKVLLPSLEYEFSSVGIFYLKVGAFYKNISKQMVNVTKELEKLQNKDKIRVVIIDLRNNPGGLLYQAIDFASIFVEKGNLVSVFSPKTKKTKEYYSRYNVFKLKSNIPIILLTNEGTASAAEVVVGALRDHKKAIVIGEKSFGKGSVQSFISLDSGNVVALTTGLYRTPSGVIIEKNGLIPDITISKMVDLDNIQQEDLLSKKFHGKGNFSENSFIINKAVEIFMNKKSD